MTCLFMIQIPKDLKIQSFLKLLHQIAPHHSFIHFMNGTTPTPTPLPVDRWWDEFWHFYNGNPNLPFGVGLWCFLYGMVALAMVYFISFVLLYWRPSCRLAVLSDVDHHQNY